MNAIKGKKQTPEHIAKRAEALRGRKGHPASDVQKEAVRLANTGKVMSLETRNKIGAQSSVWMKGNVPWNKGKKVPQITGANNKNWKGGTQSESRKQRVSFGRYVISKVFERDDYTCQICFARNGNGKKIILHVDHIKLWAEYPELRFDLDNCRTVCRPCHYYLTFKKDMPARCKWGLAPSWSVSEKIR